MMTPDTTTAEVLNVTAVADTFTASMAALDYWTFVCTVDCWIAQGDAPVATAGSGSMFVPANVTLTLSGKAGADVSVTGDASDGVASLVRCL